MKEASVGEALQRLNDFLTNAFDVRKKLDTEAPSRTSALYLINEAKKQENALADMAHGSKKLQDESTPSSNRLVYQFDLVLGIVITKMQSMPYSNVVQQNQ